MQLGEVHLSQLGMEKASKTMVNRSKTMVNHDKTMANPSN